MLPGLQPRLRQRPLNPLAQQVQRPGLFLQPGKPGHVGQWWLPRSEQLWVDCECLAPLANWGPPPTPDDAGMISAVGVVQVSLGCPFPVRDQFHCGAKG